MEGGQHIKLNWTRHRHTLSTQQKSQEMVLAPQYLGSVAAVQFPSGLLYSFLKCSRWNLPNQHHSRQCMHDSFSVENKQYKSEYRFMDSGKWLVPNRERLWQEGLGKMHVETFMIADKLRAFYHSLMPSCEHPQCCKTKYS